LLRVLPLMFCWMWRFLLLAADKGDNPEKDYCAQYRAYKSPETVGAKPAAKQEVSEPATHDTNNAVEDKTVAGSLEDFACKPAYEAAYKNCDN